MRWGARRVSCLIEALGFVAYVGWYIWRGQALMPATWWVFAVWLVASFLLRRDTPKTMGWRGDNLVGGDAESGGVFCGGERGGLRRGIVSGDAAAIADALESSRGNSWVILRFACCSRWG